MKPNFTVIALCATLATLVTHAEMRTWTDARGNTIEAEFLENMHGNVTLVRPDGTEAFIKIGQLDRLDRTDLHALPALDAGGEKRMLRQGARRAGALFPAPDHGEVAEQRGADHAHAERDGAQEFSACFLFTA